MAISERRSRSALRFFLHSSFPVAQVRVSTSEPHSIHILSKGLAIALPPNKALHSDAATVNLGACRRQGPTINVDSGGEIASPWRRR